MKREHVDRLKTVRDQQTAAIVEGKVRFFGLTRAAVGLTLVRGDVPTGSQ